MFSPVIMHITYCEQGQTIPEVCDKAAEWGFDGVEFRGPSDQEPMESYLDRVTRAAESAGLRQVLFGYPTANLMLPDPAQRRAQAARSIRFFRLAKERLKERLTLSNAFSGPLSNADPSVARDRYELHGSGCATEEQWVWVVEGFREIGAAAAELGLRLAFETHMNYLHDTCAACGKLVERIGSPAVGVNLDYANMVHFPRFPTAQEAVAILGDRLYYVHVKNCLSAPDGGKLRVGLADGEINTREFLRVLKRTGYQGPLCLEAPRPGDREWFARQDLAYLKSLIAEVA